MPVRAECEQLEHARPRRRCEQSWTCPVRGGDTHAAVDQLWASRLMAASSRRDPLLDALADLPEWYGVKAMQANWIGDCSGCYFDFQLKGSSPARSALEEALQPGADSLTEVTARSLLTGQEIPLVISRQQAFDGHLDAVIGLTREQAFDSITQKARDDKVGGHLTSATLRDWLISRQRYWGTPIPVVHCASCGPVAVPEEELPVVLPKLPSLTGKGASPLEAAHDWLHCTCPRPFERRAVDHWLPVDVYVGGKEHAVLHLYYARFLSHFCCDQGLVAHREPFRKLLVQGLIKGQTFRLAGGGPYVRREDIDFSGEEPVAAGGPLEVTWEKMSKSKHNGLDPQEVVAQYGLDTVRLYLLYAAPPDQDILWNVKTDALPGVLRWQSRLWLLVSRLRAARELGPAPDASLLKKKELAEAKSIWQHKNHTVEQGASPQVLLHSLSRVRSPQSPLLSGGGGVLQQPWPAVDPEYLQEPEFVELVVRVNNKVCGSVSVPRQLSQDAERVQQLVLESQLGQTLLAGRRIKRAILSPRTPLINYLLDE
ncbi:hypothetical protein CRUP_000262 [Coryphaenoides rupestris]|nr:hypothetical protein CRUP_000262 [Coryphaenoides rupestris]